MTGFGHLSGHTAVAVALATTLVPSLPDPATAGAITLAVIAGCARIYAGAHLPLDVIGGAGLGILCGLIARLALGVTTRRSREHRRARGGTSPHGVARTRRGL